MSGLLGVGTRALQANQVLLQTAGNNIANVNTPGYSRQSAVLQTTQGQFTGSGYIGNGVDVQTIERNFSVFLTRQSTLAGSTSAADSTRADKLGQLEGIFPGGTAGLGAAINDMLNGFSDIANAPTDLTARTVALTRVDETAKRMRAASQNLDDLQAGVTQELDQKVIAINSLAQSIAEINDKIARTQGSGQHPNDLLDQRDQLVRDLNQYVQTSSIPASDGTVGIFLAGSQALVLGNTVSPLSIGKDDFGDPLKSKLTMNRSGQFITLDESALGGGEVAGLLRFQNNDLVEGRNLLGRLTLAVSTSMNNQHQLGLDLDGNPGGNLFTPMVFTANNILPATTNAVPALPAVPASLNLDISDTTKFIASDYEVNFNSATAGKITRRSDGALTDFSFTAGVFSYREAIDPIGGPYSGKAIDGLNLSGGVGTPAAGDRFLLKPFSTSASNISAEFSTPRALAVASPVAGSLGTSNTGSLQLTSLLARSNNPTVNLPVTLKFTGSNQYIRSDDVNFANYPDLTGTLPQPTAYNYTAGQAIESNLPVNPTVTPYTYALPLAGWSVTLQGTPKAGDTFLVQAQPTANRNLNAGNASAMMGLRDAKMFDGAALTDGYASLIAQIGIRAQSANYSAEISGSIAANLERDRTGVSGVNLDEEAAKLLQYQQAYQASAKIIQIAQSIFDTLIQTLR